MKALIHVAGGTVLEGKVAPYRTERGLICSSSTLVPVAHSIGEKLEEIKTLVLLPQSLIVYAESLEDVGQLPEGDDPNELEEWLQRASLRLGDLFKERLRTGTSWLEGGGGENPIEGMEIEGRVVQVKGTFSFLGSPAEGSGRGSKRIRRKIRFDGNISHVFVEVYRFLDSGNFDSIHMDLSQGWNHLTVAAYLGAASYALTSGIELELHATEPFIPDVMAECPNLNLSQKLPPVERGIEPSNEGFGLQRPSELVLVQEMMADISSITSSSRPMISLERLKALHGLIRREFEGYGCDLREGWKVLVRSMARLRRASCAYGSVILPYLHMAILELREISRDLECVTENLRRRLESNEYVLNFNLQPGEVIKVIYNLLPPLSFPLGRAMLKAIRELNRILPECSNLGEMPLSMVDSLCESYGKAGLHTNRALLINEFDLLKEDEIRKVNDVIRSGSEGPEGGIVRHLKRYLDEMSGNAPPESIIRCRDVFPFYYSGLLKRVTPSVSDAHDPNKDWKNIYSQLKEQMEKEDKDVRVKNLKLAFDIMGGSKANPSRLLRNLVAHAGIQHFSVRNLLRKEEEVFVLYYVNLFRAIERLASANAELESIESEIGETVRTLCDGFS